MITDLRRQPAWELSLNLMWLQLQSNGRRLAHRLGWRRAGRLDPGDLEIPDSTLCRQAVEWVAQASPLFLLNHCLRCYAFAAALGRRDGGRFDRELLFLACILHDLGLTCQAEGSRAFEVEGADRAYRFLCEQGMEERRAEAVHEAIALHARVSFWLRREPEAVLLQAGAGLDVLGLRAEDLNSAARRQAVERYPRLDMKKEIAALLRHQCLSRPDSNIAGHVQLGMLRLIRQAPFEE